MDKILDCIIIGAGPAGISCGITLKKAGKDILILEKGAPGGKVNICPRVDNYPFKKEILGPDLAMDFFNRMNENEVPFKNQEVLSLKKENDLFVVETKRNIYYAKSVFCASGSKEKKLGLAREDELIGHGVSYCAICDGHFFKGKDVLVYGGEDTSIKEALHLAYLAHKVILIHNHNSFGNYERFFNELKNKNNVEILSPYIPVDILADEQVYGVKILNTESQKEITISCQGFFPLAGHIPSSSYLLIEGVKDEAGNILVNQNFESEVCPGLFAGGDALKRDIKQIYLSEHDGLVAGKHIIDYLNNHGKEN